MKTNETYMSIEDVAELLSVNYQLIYRLVRSGDLPATRVGKVYRVARSDLDAYLQRMKHNPAGRYICSACGTPYNSSHSVKYECSEKGCDEPVCVDCWTRRRVKFCAEHQKKTK